MADWIRACASDDIDDEDLVRWDHEGRSYAIYKAADGFYCTDAGRPHIKSLSHQYLISETIAQRGPNTLLAHADL